MLLTYLLFTRPRWDWKTSLGPLLLFSVPTAAYGWSFDQVVLLIPYLQIVNWVVERRMPKSSKVVVVVTLLSMAGIMLIQDWLRHTDELYFWFPWALGIVYLVARHATRTPNGTGVVPNSTTRPVDP